MTDKEHLHKLVEELGDADVPALVRIAEALVQTSRKISWEELCRILDEAPVDDEPETEEEAAAVAEAREAIARGEVYSDEEVWRQLGHDQAS